MFKPKSSNRVGLVSKLLLVVVVSVVASLFSIVPSADAGQPIYRSVDSPGGGTGCVWYGQTASFINYNWQQVNESITNEWYYYLGCSDQAAVKISYDQSIDCIGDYTTSNWNQGGSQAFVARDGGFNCNTSFTQGTHVGQSDGRTTPPWHSDFLL